MNGANTTAAGVAFIGIVAAGLFFYRWRKGSWPTRQLAYGWSTPWNRKGRRDPEEGTEKFDNMDRSLLTTANAEKRAPDWDAEVTFARGKDGEDAQRRPGTSAGQGGPLEMNPSAVKVKGSVGAARRAAANSTSPRPARGPTAAVRDEKQEATSTAGDTSSWPLPPVAYTPPGKKTAGNTATAVEGARSAGQEGGTVRVAKAVKAKAVYIDIGAGRAPTPQ